MARRRLRYGIAAGLTAAGKSLTDWMDFQQQIAKVNQQAQLEANRQAALKILGQMDPETIRSLPPDLLTSVGSGAADLAELGRRVRAPSPLEKAKPVFEQISKLDKPELAAGLSGSLGALLQAAGVDPATLVNVAPESDLMSRPGSLESLAQSALSARVKGLEPFIPTTEISSVLPTGETQSRRVPQTQLASLPPQTTALSPALIAANKLRADLAALSSPEGQQFFDLTSRREAQAAGQKRAAEEGAATPEIVNRFEKQKRIEQQIADEEYQKEESKKAEAAAVTAKSAMDLIDELIPVVDPATQQRQLTPSLHKMLGGVVRVPPWAGRTGFGGPTLANTQATIDQLVGQQILGLMAQMKAQSKTGATGFGQLSQKELDLLTQSATRLTNQAQSPEKYFQLLTDLRTVMQKLAGGGLNRTTWGSKVTWPGSEK